MQKLRICFVITEDWYFWSHRLSLARYLVAHGHDVHLVTRLTNLEEKIKSEGITPHTVGMQRDSKNPFAEAVVTARMSGLLRQLQPDVVHLVGMKPILYGSLAAKVAGVPAVCAIAGLGWLFTPGGTIKAVARKTVSAYFRYVLAKQEKVKFIVQNSHHRDFLLERRMASHEQIVTISGAGVDIHRFKFRPEKRGAPRILTHARMLWDKGIGDLVEAARIIKGQGIACDFQLVGDPDPANPASIPSEQLKAWTEEGIVHWQGRRDDIPELLQQSHIACLPSYHEGFPLSLVEAMSCGRPVVSNDIPGCRDAVTHGLTGLLVPKGDVRALALALTRLIQDSETRVRYGTRARKEVMRRMSNEIVNQRSWNCYENILGLESPREATPLPRKAA